MFKSYFNFLFFTIITVQNLRSSESSEADFRNNLAFREALIPFVIWQLEMPGINEFIIKAGQNDFSYDDLSNQAFVKDKILFLSSLNQCSKTFYKLTKTHMLSYFFLNLWSETTAVLCFGEKQTHYIPLTNSDFILRQGNETLIDYKKIVTLNRFAKVLAKARLFLENVPCNSNLSSCTSSMQHCLYRLALAAQYGNLQGFYSLAMRYDTEEELITYLNRSNSKPTDEGIEWQHDMIFVNKLQNNIENIALFLLKQFFLDTGKSVLLPVSYLTIYTLKNKLKQNKIELFLADESTKYCNRQLTKIPDNWYVIPWNNFFHKIDEQTLTKELDEAIVYSKNEVEESLLLYRDGTHFGFYKSVGNWTYDGHYVFYTAPSQSAKFLFKSMVLNGFIAGQENLFANFLEPLTIESKQYGSEKAYSCFQLGCSIQVLEDHYVKVHAITDPSSRKNCTNPFSCIVQ
ncbi:hypothetical protein IPH25_02465 [bacterium]|nr:MAG: hypothetical protein IPG37_04605 [bacterium]QQR62286.1 MAG: hypothetical protein IPH25_02465 [bacterium]